MIRSKMVLLFPVRCRACPDILLLKPWIAFQDCLGRIAGSQHAHNMFNCQSSPFDYGFPGKNPLQLNGEKTKAALHYKKQQGCAGGLFSRA